MKSFCLMIRWCLMMMFFLMFMGLDSDQLVYCNRNLEPIQCSVGSMLDWFRISIKTHQTLRLWGYDSCDSPNSPVNSWANDLACTGP